ncbi:zinc finger protein SNAI3 [Erinaceus europaeus]|uniref:Zinc finger protein SNAI3 n=1 Tax=Erinaceus europaeus TaxID=9365 RepID=A0A1S3A9A4_ERIEU|nr:zinc finger protein SNAI3 [Erinaceus europaeus]
MLMSYANEPSPSLHLPAALPSADRIRRRPPESPTQEIIMPRSFLVKTHFSPRAPNYRKLETQREINGSCSACRKLAGPLFLPEKAASSSPSDLPRPLNHTSVITYVSLPLPYNEEIQGASGSDSLETRHVDLQAVQTLNTPLKDSWNHLNLPPLLALPTQWPSILGPDGDQDPDRLLGAERASHSTGSLQYFHCHNAHAVVALQCFSCRHCDKEYNSLGALKMHMRTHTLPCTCAICGKAFSRPWLLQGHIRTHTGEKPYTCSHCSRAFADRSNLRAHLQTHSDTKRYRCRSCAKTFSRMSLLARHEDSGCHPGP